MMDLDQEPIEIKEFKDSNALYHGSFLKGTLNIKHGRVCTINSDGSIEDELYKNN